MTIQNKPELVRIANRRFPYLSPKDVEFLTAVEEGALFDGGNQLVTDPASSNEADKSRAQVFKATLIIWVCTNKKAVPLVTRHGIGLERATIDGKLDLSSIRVPFPLVLKNCFLAKDVKLCNACIGALDMTGTQATKLDAKALHVDGDIVLKNGFKAKGPVILAGATIGGNLDFTNAILTSASRGNALDCERVTVKGNALLCSDSRHKTGFTANGGVSLAHARIGGNLVCKGGVFLNPEKHALLATGLQVEGSVYLNNGFRAKGSVGFVDATINRSLQCNNGEFINPDGMALDCERLNTGGDVFFCEGHWGNDPKAPVDYFKAVGEVKLVNAQIGGNLECKSGKFINSDGNALLARGLTVLGNVFLRNGFRGEGSVGFVDATINGNLECNNGEFINPGGMALDCERLNAGGDVFFCEGHWGNDPKAPVDYFKAVGEVKLVNAQIGGNLECKSGKFINSDGNALLARGLTVLGNVFLRNGFRGEGSVGFVDATINGNLECNNGEFINPGGMALDCERLNAGGDVFFCEGHWGNDPKAPVDYFKAVGEVKLVNAQIGGNLECKSGKFINSDGNALLARGLTVLGNVFLRNGFRGEGSVGFVDATINGNLECNNGEFINPGGMALDCIRLNARGDVFFSKRKGQRSDDPNAKVKSFEAQGTVSFVCAEIRGYFSWLDVNSPDKVTLDLRYAKVGIYRDDIESWPTAGKLRLEGFRYDSIDESDPSKVSDRVKWLRLQYPKTGKVPFYTQPYEQLAHVFKSIGLDKAAKNILIKKNKDRSRKANLSFSEKCWYRGFGKIIGYGYNPWPSLIVVLLLIALGYFVFDKAYENGLMTPTDARAIISRPANMKQQISKDYPVFNALVYSIDTFVPLVDLRVSKHYLPNANRRKPVPPSKSFAPFENGSYIRIYLWFHMAAGWILTSLLVVGLTGLVRS